MRLVSGVALGRSCLRVWGGGQDDQRRESRTWDPGWPWHCLVGVEVTKNSGGSGGGGCEDQGARREMGVVVVK